jgi:hypothetical protein
MIGSNLFVTPRDAEARLNLACNTSIRALSLLEHRKFLSPVPGARRGRAFGAPAIQDILKEPARMERG